MRQRTGYRRLLHPFRAAYRFWQLPSAAKAERRQDRLGLPLFAPGIDLALEESAAWLGRAQDASTSQDGGVAHHFSLLTGWGASYPETTGYIVPTMLDCARYWNDDTLRQRAKRMLDWLVSIQLPNGAFQGRSIRTASNVPVAFNTGQILIGLARGVQEFGAGYREAMDRAADWLVKIQDPDGCWRKGSSPSTVPGEKSYDTHIAWGLWEAARVAPDSPYADSALANVQWALQHQRENGWFDRCCLTDPARPLTHTLGYALRGLIEAYRFTQDQRLLRAAQRTADGLLTVLGPDGFLPGRLYPNWQGAVSWACLTGSVQIACCWLKLYQDTGDPRYRDAACITNRYVRRTIKIEGPPETRGAIKGSFPVQGGYFPYAYPNWASKFFIDAHLLEKSMRGERDDESYP